MTVGADLMPVCDYRPASPLEGSPLPRSLVVLPNFRDSAATIGAYGQSVKWLLDTWHLPLDPRTERGGGQRVTGYRMDLGAWASSRTLWSWWSDPLTRRTHCQRRIKRLRRKPLYATLRLHLIQSHENRTMRAHVADASRVGNIYRSFYGRVAVV